MQRQTRFFLYIYIYIYILFKMQSKTRETETFYLRRKGRALSTFQRRLFIQNPYTHATCQSTQSTTPESHSVFISISKGLHNTHIDMSTIYKSMSTLDIYPFQNSSTIHKSMFTLDNYPVKNSSTIYKSMSTLDIYPFHNSN
jgi:hypothetical protein